MINSKEKGKRGERLAASKLKEYGWPARRSQQYAGSNNDADLFGGPDNHHIEVKFVERLNLEAAYIQSKTEAKTGEIPIVMHKKSRGPWMVTLSADDYFGAVLGGSWDDPDKVQK